MTQTKTKTCARRHRTGLAAMNLLLAAILCIALSGCGKDETAGKTEAPDKTEAKAMATDPLDKDGDAILANWEENGIMPSPQGYTLADAFAAINSQMGKCKVTRPASDKILFVADRAWRSMEGEICDVEVDITLAREKELGTVAVIDGMVMLSEDDFPAQQYDSAETHAVLMQLIKDGKKVQQQKAAARLKELVANLPDGDAELTWREPGGGLSTDTNGLTLADAVKALAIFPTKVDPTLERDGEKVRIVRKSSKANMTAELSIADGADGGKVAVVESFHYESDKEGPTEYVGEKAYNVVSGLISKAQDAAERDSLVNGGLSDSEW